VQAIVSLRQEGVLMKSRGQRLQAVSCHAASLDGAMLAVIGYLEEQAGVRIDFLNQVDWMERYRLLDAGEVDLAWICGAPYVRRVDGAAAPIELLAAPIWQGVRYGGRPVYFADVVVRQASPARTLAELTGAHWVYNEPGSLSGYAAMRHQLAEQGWGLDLFGRVSESGAHVRSLGLLLAGEADVTVLDSVVLEAYWQANPAQRPLLRSVAAIGPLPSMPWVVARQVAEPVRARLRQALWSLPRGVAPWLAGFAPVVDGDYDGVRRVLGEEGRKNLG
jgi:phosphonate transport system substrate-binding protein